MPWAMRARPDGATLRNAQQRSARDSAEPWPRRGLVPIPGASFSGAGVGFPVDRRVLFFAAAFLAVGRPGAGRSVGDSLHSWTQASISGQVLVRAQRPVSIPRCPPGTISNRTSADPESMGTTDLTDPRGAMPSFAPAKTRTGTVMSATEI